MNESSISINSIWKRHQSTFIYVSTIIMPSKGEKGLGVPETSIVSSGSGKSRTTKSGKSQDSDYPQENDRDRSRSISNKDRDRRRREAFDSKKKAEAEAKATPQAAKRGCPISYGLHTGK